MKSQQILFAPVPHLDSETWHHSSKVQPLHPTLMLVLAALLVLPLQAPSAQSPETFVRSIYSRYKSQMPDYNGRQAEAVFSPSLLQLIRKNGTTGFIGHLDIDPVCSCNEIDGLAVDRIAVSRLAADHALATVSLSFGNAGSQILRLTLISVNGDWRVDDITSAAVGSLRSKLIQGTHAR